MKDKNTIINEIVDNASEILEQKKEYNKIVIELLEEKKQTDNIHTINTLKEDNTKITEAIILMRKYSGCWA